MYRSYYSLSREPFSKSILSSEIYCSRTSKELIARLEYLKRIRGIALITGEPGAGKTLMLRTFCENLNPSLYKVIYFKMVSLSSNDFYRGLAIESGEEPKHKKIDLFRQIQKSISQHFYERKITPVIILDELQLIRDGILSELSSIFNFGMDSENPFILIFAGLPYIHNKLMLNQHRPLYQRIAAKFKLEALTKTETSEYISHLMKISGSKFNLFSSNAVDSIYSLASGWPRLINQLCTHCLIAGFHSKKDLIDEEIVRIAAEESGI